ncbi:MAG: hypothetical protein H0T79_08255, partial [Deltaproteobacteria bacterium]|nr:hypothetical protein [Deltaproteobacteria bacterium]
MLAVLEPILTALHAGRLGAALELMLARWRRAPHPRLADAIDALSAIARVPTPDELRSNHPDHDGVWAVRMSRHTVLELPALLDTLPDTALAEANYRMGMLAHVPDDPRVEAALVGWLETLPFQSYKSQRFWTLVFARLERLRDTRQRARLALLDQHLADNVLGGRMNQTLRDQLA